MLDELVLEDDVDYNGIIYLGNLDKNSMIQKDNLGKIASTVIKERLLHNPRSSEQPIFAEDIRDFLNLAPLIDPFKLTEAFKDGTIAVFEEILEHMVPRPLQEYIDLLSNFGVAKKYFNKEIEKFKRTPYLEFIATNGIGFHEDDLFDERYGGQSKYNLFVCINNMNNYKFASREAEFIPLVGDVYLFNQNIAHAVIPTRDIAFLKTESKDMIQFLAFTEVYNS